MKSKIIVLFSCLFCLIIGFFLFPVVFGKKLSEEHEQIAIYNNFGIFDNLIVEIYNLNDTSNNLDSILSIMCEQLKQTYEAAIAAGEPHVDLLNHLDYGKDVTKRFNRLAAKNGSDPCSVD